MGLIGERGAERSKMRDECQVAVVMDSAFALPSYLPIAAPTAAIEGRFRRKGIRDKAGD